MNETLISYKYDESFIFWQFYDKFELLNFLLKIPKGIAAIYVRCGGK